MRLGEFAKLIATDTVESVVGIGRKIAGQPPSPASDVDRNRLHAREFEEKTGMTGIAGNYNFPEGFDIDYPGKYPFSQGENTTVWGGIAEELKELNPQLNSVRYDENDEKQVLDFVWGVFSAFNPEDIDYYLNASEEELNDTHRRQARIENEIINRNNTTILERYLERNFGPGYFSWVASPATLDKIEAQLTRDSSVDSPIVPVGTDPTVNPEQAVEGRHANAISSSASRTRQTSKL